MQQNTIQRINDVLAEGIRTRGNDATLEELLGLTDAANGALGDLLGAFTNTNNLKALLGDLHPTTKQLGQILGGFGHTENLKDILGDLTTTKNLGGILGAFSAAQNLKAILGNLSATKRLGETLGLLSETNTLYNLLGGADAISNPIATDTKYIRTTAIGTPTGDSIGDEVQFIAHKALAAPAADSVGEKVTNIEVDTEKLYDAAFGVSPVGGSLASFIATGGTGLGTSLGASRSIVDALGHTGLAVLGTGLGANIGDFLSETNLKSILAVLGGGWDDANAGAGRDMFTSIEGATGIFHEQADAGFSIAVDNVGVDILDLNVATTRYIIRDLRVKLDADPGANTVTISLETLINSLPVVVDTFAIDTANWGSYHSLMDMFGVPHIAGDDVHIYATYSVAGPITLKGQYSHGKTNV